MNVTLPNGQVIENVPEGASKADIMRKAISNGFATESDFSSKSTPKAPVDHYKQAFDKRNGLEQFMIGAGGGLTGLYKGAKQRMGLTDPNEVKQYRNSMNPVNDSGYGMAGNITGKIAGTIPAAFAPGANTVVGAALVGGGMGALEPTLEGESVLGNIAVGTAGGAIGQKVGGEVSKRLLNHATGKTAKIASQKAADSVRNATLNQSKNAGYVVPPSYAKSGLGSRLLEGVSGKYKTNQMAGIKNQQVTNDLAKKALGLTDDAPITKQTLQGIRNNAYSKGYEPLHNLGKIVPDADYKSALDKIVASRNSASKSFPGAVSDDVTGIIDPLRVSSFDSSHAIELTKVYREAANKAYSGGDKALGKAYKSASNALEDQIERTLSKSDDMADLLANFRSARTDMAKTFSVEKALIEGTGDIDAIKIAKEFGKGKPLTDELKSIGKFGQSFNDVARIPKSGDANPLTIMDMGVGMAGMGIDPTLMALPAARVASRSAILSPQFQSKFVNPSYGNAGLSNATGGLLSNEIMKAITPRLTAAGLLGSNLPAK